MSEGKARPVDSVVAEVGTSREHSPRREASTSWTWSLVLLEERRHTVPAEVLDRQHDGIETIVHRPGVDTLAATALVGVGLLGGVHSY
jgi:hypothetical protein